MGCSTDFFLPREFAPHADRANVSTRSRRSWTRPLHRALRQPRSNPDAGDTPGALVVRSASTWLYYNAEHICRRLLDMIDAAPTKITAVVLDFSSVPDIDITAGTILRGLVRTLKERGIRVEVAELRDEVVEQLKIIGAEHAPVPVFVL